MPTITKDNAKQYCRTCLIKLDDVTSTNCKEENEWKHPPPPPPLTEDAMDVKDIAINITTNENLKQMIEQYIEERKDLHCSEYPQHVCLVCFNKLQGFDRFRKKALECRATLLTLFIEGVPKLELDEAEEEKENSNENIYSLMLKDALMETETVVLMEHSDISALVNCELQIPDPFSAEIISKSAKKEEKKRKNTIIESTNNEHNGDDDDGCDNVGDWTDNNTTDNDDDEDKPLSCLRSASNKKLLRPKTKEPACRPKYRRRTKKEMELVRKEQDERDALRKKPRKKGTKNSYRCDQCNHSFAHKLTRDAHIRKVHEGSKRPYQCDRCDKTYTFFGGLWTHIREIHEAQERSYPCAYPDCDKIYTSLIAMQKHRREKHLGLVNSKTYVCELCGTTFNQIANLKYHRRRKHPMETGDEGGTAKEESKERHICNICNKQFHSRYTLKYHVLQLHSSDMKFECTVCGRRMAKKFMLVQHMRIHTLDRLPCGQCEKQFIRKHELEAHVRAVHLKLKPYGCQYCPETFACRKTLRHHEYIHTGEKPYVCDICGQAYRQQTSLKTHRKSHETMTAEMMLAKNINRTLENFLGGVGHQQVQLEDIEAQQQKQPQQQQQQEQ